MPETVFRERRAVEIENEHLRVTVLREGGHVAEVFDKEAGISPLWTPHWRSIEPSTYSPETHPELGTGSEAKLLGGIMGHNLCLDLFGGPSSEEEAAGYTAHGEASVLPYAITEGVEGLSAQVHLPLAQLRVTRTLALHGRSIRVREKVENLAWFDRPVGWTEHVTLGAPFLDEKTEFRASMTRSLAYEGGFGAEDYLQAGAEFTWPIAPGRNGEPVDLRRIGSAPSSSYTAHLADPARHDAFFVAFSRPYQLAFGYMWKRADFPWMGIWEENHSRQGPPWNGQEVTRGMEFGVSPFPESRRQMVERGKVFDTLGFGWLAARGSREVEYWILSWEASEVPETVSWIETNVSIGMLEPMSGVEPLTY